VRIGLVATIIFVLPPFLLPDPPRRPDPVPACGASTIRAKRARARGCALGKV
jgi:hypothetical protein